MATTTQHRQRTASPAPQLLLALDLGLTSWTLGFARDFSDAPWVREMAGGDGDTLRKVIAQAKRHLILRDNFHRPITTSLRCRVTAPQ